MTRIDADRAPGEADHPVVCRPVRYGMLAFAWLNVGLGVVGMALPVMPTTVFLLIALWAFSRCSLRFHGWLYAHPVLGRTIRDWHAHRVISLRAKLLAVSMMAASLVYVTLFVAQDWVLPSVLAATLAAVGGFIVSRPSRAAS
ncbi:MAG: YbaN family protein [Proteobacteria bacterium]|nr:YbaN family protein [Pseudomonadota bacterium]